MDSAKKMNQNTIYGKINSLDVEDQSTTTIATKTKTSQKNDYAVSTPLIIIIISISTLIALAIIFIVSTSTNNTRSSSLSSDDSIKLICNTTRYPDTCFKSISSSYYNTTSAPKPDPESIFKLSLQVAITEISTLSSFIVTANLNATLAVKDCVDLLGDAVSGLNDSVTVMTVGAGEKILTDEKISDIQTWVSAALTDQETCTDGLEDVESTGVMDVKIKVEKSKEYVSNALAILANIISLLGKFGQSLH